MRLSVLVRTRGLAIGNSLTLALAVPLAFICVLTLAFLAFQLSYLGRIYPGVRVLSLNVGGMTPADAHALVSRQFAAYGERPIHLVAGDRVWDLTPSDLGLRTDVDAAIRAAYDVGRTGSISDRLQSVVAGLRGESVDLDLPLLLDSARRDRQIEAIAHAIDRPVVDARVTLDSNLRPAFHHSQSGRKVDMAGLRSLIDSRLRAMSPDPVVASVAVTPPSVPDEMLAKDFERLQWTISSPFTLRFQDRSWAIQPAEIAGAIQLRSSATGSAPLFQFDDAKLNAIGERLKREIDRAPIDARIQLRGGEPAVLRPSQEGLAVEVDRLIAALKQTLPTQERSLTVPVASVRPAFASEDREVFRNAELIAEASTDYQGSIPERAHNVELATARLNGVVVPPGKMFSFNEELGPTTLKSGFQIGWGITSSGGQVETVPSVAGGICQVSTTLFQAVFRAGYTIEERNYHLYWIPRYGQPPLGMTGLDATVDAPSVDLKFINSSSHPLLIQTRTDGKRVFFSLLGVKPSWQVTIEGPVIDQVVKADPTVVRQEDPSMPAGRQLWIEEARDGFRSTIVRTVVDGDDKRVLRLVSSYHPSRNVVLVGTKK